MLSELFQSISKQAAAAAGQSRRLEIFEIPGDPRSRIVTFGDHKEQVSVPPPIREHEVESLEDLITLTAVSGAKRSVIWHNATSVVAILDDDDRRDRAALQLVFSDQFQAIASEMLFDQAKLIRFLRIRLAGTGAERFVPVFRKLDFHRSNKAAATVKHGDESLGRSIEAKVQGTEDIPEEITISVPVYANPGLRKAEEVCLAVEIDVSNERFALIPLADELDMAQQLAQASIREKLLGLIRSAKLEDRVSVFWGRP